MRLFAMFAVVLVSLFTSSLSMAADDTPPNIVWLIADDMSPTTGPGRILTPNLDRLASEGVRFSRMFVNVASCTASRCSFTSGRYPQSMDCGDMSVPLDQGIPLLPTMLRPAGYFSANVGKFHIDASGRITQHGKKQYDLMLGKLHHWEKFFDQRPKDKPFFLMVGFHDPHRPYRNAPKVHKPSDIYIPPYLADMPAVRNELTQYADEVARLDAEVGEILERLETEGLADNTIVVFFSDHGHPFLRGKTQVYDSGTHIPFIVRWPGHVPAGKVHRGLHEMVELVPTMCEAAGVKPADTVHGQSFLRAMLEPDSSGRKYVFQERNWHGNDDHVRAVRSDRYRYIVNAYPDEPMAHPTDLLRGPAFQAMRKLFDAGKLPPHQAALFRVPRPAEELYDLYADPHEIQNRADDPALASIKSELRAQLEAYNDKYATFGPERRYHDKADRTTGERTGRSRREPEPRK